MRSRPSVLACVVAMFAAKLWLAAVTAADERPVRILLLDGSNRWRSLLLGAPPLLP